MTSKLAKLRQSADMLGLDQAVVNKADLKLTSVFFSLSSRHISATLTLLQKRFAFLNSVFDIV